MKVCQRCRKSHDGKGTKWCEACGTVVRREQKAAQMRRYWKTEKGKAQLRARRKDPKHEHNYRSRRLQRAAQSDDGTITAAVLRGEFARTHCPYCAEPMQTKDKQLDHMQPLSLGGMHSACNVLVCCEACNGRKSNLPFVDWLSTLNPEQAKQCRALWVKRNGAPPEQGCMSLPDPAVVVRRMRSLHERVTREAIAEAKRARAAWFKRDAPDEWMGAYWEGMGEPWRNPRITQAERFRLRYELMPGFREAQQAKVRRWKERNPSMVADQRVRRRERQANDAAH